MRRHHAALLRVPPVVAPGALRDPHDRRRDRRLLLPVAPPTGTRHAADHRPLAVRFSLDKTAAGAGNDSRCSDDPRRFLRNNGAAPTITGAMRNPALTSTSRSLPL